MRQVLSHNKGRSELNTVSRPKCICIIPSRLQSTRLPQKPLASIQGRPMIEWTYQAAARSGLFDTVAVATDDEKIAELIRQLGGIAHLTPGDLSTGSDRVAYTVEHFYRDADVVVNLQGDEPFVKTAMLSSLIAPYLSGENPCMSTLAFPLEEANHANPDKVKVLIDKQGYALYFSRAPIPYQRVKSKQALPVYHHMGLYAFRADFLKVYTMLPKTVLEETESLEQLRVLEHGYRIKVCLTTERSLEINTPEELALAQTFDYSE